MVHGVEAAGQRVRELHVRVVEVADDLGRGAKVAGLDPPPVRVRDRRVGLEERRHVAVDAVGHEVEVVQLQAAGDDRPPVVDQGGQLRANAPTDVVLDRDDARLLADQAR